MNPTPSPGWKAKYAWSEVDRVEPPKREVTDRLRDFREIDIPYDEETAKAQASRCIQCPNPNCVAACPLGTPIVDLLGLTADGQFKEAAALLFATHTMPEIASHICVGGRVCENVCVLSGKSDTVPIRSITKFLLHYGWKHGLAEPPLSQEKGQRVAVIGSGICGLVCADALSRMGYAVTVMDSRQKPGGRMMNGLPGFRVDKALVERRVELLKQQGVQFRMGVICGQDVKLRDLRREFDAVFLGFSRAEPLPLEVPGAELRGVYQVFPFVSQSVAKAQPGTVPMDVRGRRVVVLGGGDTAMDALRIAIRRGAREALCIYRRDRANMPADAEEIANAQEEGARFQFLSQPVAIIGNAAGEVTHVRCVRMELDQPDETGRVGVKRVAGFEFDVPADVVLVAYGFTAPKLPPTDEFASLALNDRGYPLVDENQMTNLPGVFAGGSIVRGAVPLVEVVRDARKAATTIDRFLETRRLQAGAMLAGRAQSKTGGTK
jgi:glutamate synthase (NADPH/NADH) small chain